MGFRFVSNTRERTFSQATRGLRPLRLSAGPPPPGAPPWLALPDRCLAFFLSGPVLPDLAIARGPPSRWKQMHCRSGGSPAAGFGARPARPEGLAVMRAPQVVRVKG